MNNLSQFTPAELDILRRESSAKRKDLLKLTLSDLIFKQVLRTIRVANDNENAQVVRGSKFGTYRSKPHEKVFLQPFVQMPDSAIPFKQLVKIGFQESKSDSQYRNLILQSPDMIGFTKKGFFSALTGSFSLTSAGEHAKRQLWKELHDTGEQMKYAMQHNRADALVMLGMLGGSALLVSQMNSDFANTIDTLTTDEMRKQQMQSASTDGGSSGYGTTDETGGSWDIFDSSFESSFDSGAAESGGGDSGGGDSGSDGGSDGGGCSGGCGGGCS